MADKNKDSSRSSVRDRVVLYTSPVVTSVLLAIVFYQLTLHQTHLREMQLHINSLAITVLQHSKYIDSPAKESLLRYARETGNDKGKNDVQMLDEYFGRVAERQVGVLEHNFSTVITNYLFKFISCIATCS